jgi:uroporphyrinogen-III decarboxylase
MTQQQWETLVKCSKCEKTETIPVGFIIDSPWLPGYAGISTIDYFTNINTWFNANMKAINEFSDAIFLPGFWAEIGMTAEPSGYGCPVNFYNDKTPTAQHIAESCSDAAKKKIPNPIHDGLMPFVLNIYKDGEKMANDAGHRIKIVAARGPLTLATHLIGVTNFLTDIKMDPDGSHKLLKSTTRTVINWLEAQANALNEVEGILVLDDIVGFLSKEDYLEFAHPYLKEIFTAFPSSMKLYHNDTNNEIYYEFLKDLGINFFNFSHLYNIKSARNLIGDGICLIGNIPPVESLVKGTPEQVIKDVTKCLDDYAGSSGILLSAGGGLSPGTKPENLGAMIECVRNYKK